MHRRPRLVARVSKIGCGFRVKWARAQNEKGSDIDMHCIERDRGVTGTDAVGYLGAFEPTLPDATAATSFVARLMLISVLAWPRLHRENTPAALP